MSAELIVRVVVFSVLATMAVAIALDFIARPGAKDPYDRLGRLPQIPHPVKRVRRTLAPPLRFREVLAIARQNGLLHRRFASAAGIADPEFGPCCARRSRTVAACSSSSARSRRRAATCSRHR